MTHHSTRCILFSAMLLVVLSVCALVVNLFIYHFPGNNYFPPATAYIGLTLILMYSGSSLIFSINGQLTKGLKELIYFFLIMSIIALATNASQYTPFPTIDNKILTIERSFHIDIKHIISWTHTRPHFKTVLAFVYDTLPYQMTYLPLFMIAVKQLQHLREYYFLLLISTIIGFTFYYFFPTTAPASIISSSYFSSSQIATGLKFIEIRQHIQPTTIEGGMIALPSFHAIWAWLCLYLLRGVPIGVMIMLPINLLLVISCVLLGWHYPMDILGAMVVVVLSHGIYYFCRLSRPLIHHPH